MQNAALAKSQSVSQGWKRKGVQSDVTCRVTLCHTPHLRVLAPPEGLRSGARGTRSATRRFALSACPSVPQGRLRTIGACLALTVYPGSFGEAHWEIWKQGLKKLWLCIFRRQQRLLGKIGRKESRSIIANWESCQKTQQQNQPSQTMQLRQ